MMNANAEVAIEQTLESMEIASAALRRTVQGLVSIGLSCNVAACSSCSAASNEPGSCSLAAFFRGPETREVKGTPLLHDILSFISACLKDPTCLFCLFGFIFRSRVSQSLSHVTVTCHCVCYRSAHVRRRMHHLHAIV